MRDRRDPNGYGLPGYWAESSVPELLGQDDCDHLGADPAKAAIGFDLRLTLREQLEQAKRLLQRLAN